MGKMSLTSCRALSTPGKFSNVDRYVLLISASSAHEDLRFLIDKEGPYMLFSVT